MMRWPLIALCLLWGTSALASDVEADALRLADDTPSSTTEQRPWQAYAEVAAGRARPQAAGMAQDDGRLSLDWRLEPATSGPWHVRAAGRLDMRSRPALVQEHTIHTLKDAVLGYTPTQNLVLEAGRIRLRQGVALGYNPTDFFRDGSIRSEVSMDPASLRENRQGSAMLHLQHHSTNGVWQLAFSPRLAMDKPAPGGWNLDWGATNHLNRALLAYAPRWGESISAQGLLHLRQGQGAQWGLNLSGLLGQATVAYLEWSGGASPTQLQQALGLVGPEQWHHRLAAGARHTRANQLTLTAELHYNGAAPGRRGWQALRAMPLPVYGQYRAWAVNALEPATRHGLFLHAAWKDAVRPDLDLNGICQFDLDDASHRCWLELRHRGRRLDMALQWQRNHGAALSHFGAWPWAARWELIARHYF
ncbi:MAG: hypothetical protein LWW82_02390 [Comamonadaceae bacterium]|nr:hypothetical protein [Comamonadaceae bacterium]